MMSFQKIYSPTQLANAMKLVRQQNGWTQSELAKNIGANPARQRWCRDVNTRRRNRNASDNGMGKAY